MIPTSETGPEAPMGPAQDREAREAATDAAFENLLKLAPDGLAEYAWNQISRGLLGNPSFGHVVEIARVCLDGKRYDDDDGSWWWLDSQQCLSHHNYPPPRPA